MIKKTKTELTKTKYSQKNNLSETENPLWKLTETNVI